jgi:hypothetical protein
LVLHKTKWKYAQMNILVGFITMLIPLMGLLAIISASAGGSMGVFLWEESKNIATSIGAALIFLLVFIIGLIVFLDTNPGEVLAFLSGLPNLLAPVGAAASKVGGLVKRGDESKEVMTYQVMVLRLNYLVLMKNTGHPQWLNQPIKILIKKLSQLRL